MPENKRRQILVRLEKVFRNYNTGVGPAKTDRRTHDFAFHMTDWYDDLMQLAVLYKYPSRHDQKEWNRVVYGFLIHAVGHMMAAAELNDSLLDPFGVARKAKGPARATKRTKGTKLAGASAAA